MVEMLLKWKDAVDFPELLPSQCQPSGSLQVQRILDGWHYVEHRIIQPTEFQSLNLLFFFFDMM